MVRLIEIKEGTKTRYVTEEAYQKIMERKKDRTVSAGDITCSDAKSVALGFTDEQYNSIFRKEKTNE